MPERGQVNRWRIGRTGWTCRFADLISFDILLGSNTLIDNDRRAVALDLSPINRWVSTSANEIE